MQVFKFSASGNVFVLVDQRLKSNQVVKTKDRARLAQRLSREFASDGVLFLSWGPRVVFFNPDGSRAFCGNGTRAAGFYEIRWRQKKNKGIVAITTDAGVIPVRVDGEKAALIDVSMPKYQGSRSIRSPYPLSPKPYTLFHKVWSGCPHAVTFVENLEKLNIENLGRKIRYHKNFSPRGANVDFVKVINSKKIKMRTYERGVEKETASCGSGVLAVSLLARKLGFVKSSRFVVETPGGSFDVWFNGKEKISMGGKVENLGSLVGSGLEL